MTSGRHVRSKQRRRALPAALIIGGLVLAGGAVAWQAHAWLWMNHSNRVGAALVQQERSRQARDARDPTLAACTSAATTTTAADAGAGPQGLLEIPAIGLVAPVEQGVDDAALNVAVGHLTNSVWPGEAGNAVLEAHDVSYFVNIDKLKTGDLIRYSTPCFTDVFSVQSHQVVTQGSPVYNTSTPSITLVTCWPTNALWFTPQRYLVTASHLLNVTRTGPQGIGAGAGAASIQVPASAAAPTVPAPTALASEGLTLATFSIPMGPLTIAGQPDASWVQGPGPLAVEGSAVEAFIAGVRSLTQNRTDWWNAIAPGVPRPPAMVGSALPSYTQHLAVTVTTNKSTPSTVAMTTAVGITGGGAPGPYSLNVTATITGAQILITAWTLTPA